MMCSKPQLAAPSMRLLLAFSLALFPPLVRGQSVVINEIMYHPASHDSREEYVELYNPSATDVSLGGWALRGGVDFVIPSNTVIRAADYFVIAARRQTFVAKYPTITNVVGDYAVLRVTNLASSSITNWENTLSNTRNSIELADAAGDRVDVVQYADEGDWARRQRGFLDGNFRGWTWYTEADGLGKSLELINSALPNEHGQNWTESVPVNGTPGRVNSVVSANIAPMIIDVAHFPIVPRSTNSISVTARIINESSSGVTVTLRRRVDSASPPAFGSSAMFDDGAHGDGLPGDGIYAATIPAQVNSAVIEFYIEASDAQGNSRTWPAPAIAALDGGGPTGQVANALLQVDDAPQNTFGGTSSSQPVYKVIMTEAERAELASIPGQSSNQGPNAQMNGTFISIDGVETLVRYTVGVRNRGHASRRANPPNYRINFVADRLWKQVEALNLNTVQVHIQHFGSTLAVKSGAAGSLSRAVQVRVNNVNRATSGSPMFGSYAANEVYSGEWADRQFPSDGGGNVYKVVRDILPPNFDYRGEDKTAYMNTYFKETNTGEDDWRDLIGMLSIMGENSGPAFTTTAARQVVNVEQWFTHLAVMNLLGNAESGLNTGNNDDYYMYRGVDDPRFILMFHDLDQIIGQGGSFGTGSDIFRATGAPVSGDSEGVWRAMTIFMHWPDFEPIYYATLQRLLDTTFSKPQFDSLIDQTLSSYVSSGTINSMKTWMDARRSYVQGVITGLVPPATNNPVATISAEPRSPSPSRSATLTVGGDSITSYRFKLNNGAYGAETPVATPISLSNLPQGSTNTVYVVGKNSGGIFQSTTSPTISKAWVVNTNTPLVRLNEVLAANNGVVNHAGTTPDIIELFNEGTASVDLSGLRLTNNKDDPNKFTFVNSTILPAGGYLTVYANNEDGTGGIHAGFSLSAEGDQLYLFDRVASGNTILDVVKFGVQVPNLSIGRTGTSGDWALTTPSFGAVNSAQPLGDERNLKINEWLTSSSSENDFIELYNPNSSPVSIGGLYITDRPIGAPALSRIEDLSFVGANSFAVFVADGDADKADHVNFQLPSEQGEIALLTSTLKTIDCIVYGPQRIGVSMGRCPDGSLTNRFLTFPTPAFMNSCPAVPPGPQTIGLVGYSDVWRFNQDSDFYATNWTEASFPDSAWPNSGPGAFANGGISGVAVNTIINNTTGTVYFRTTFVLPANANFTSVQLTHFIDDGGVIYVNGKEAHRHNMNPGAVNHATRAASNNAGQPNEVTVSNFPLTNAFPGVNMLAVSLHPRPDFFPGGDAVMGLKLEGIIVTNSAAQAGIVINEILADNASAEEADGSTPDWVELYNPSSNAVNLADMSLSDTLANPRRWVFPSGSIISAQGYFRVRFDSDLPVSTTNTGYGLRTTGDAVYLFNALADGGGVRDLIIFGIQIPDYSIARLPDGSTNLALPTIGFPNIAATLGDPRQLKVNEWMSNPLPGEDDFFEIYNPGSQPVALGGLWLTDVLTTRNKHQIASLSFIGAITNAWTEFKADGNTTSGADHVGFSLRSSTEDVGISLPDLTLIDGISFTNQAEGVSIGRLPDGANATAPFVTTASPGSANYLLLPNVAVNEALTHTDLPFEDAIELRNLTGTNVNIGGWWLSDAESQPQRYQIPSGTILPANGFAVFYEYQFNDPDTAVVPFSLSSAKGDQIYLSMANSNGVLAGYRAVAEFDASANGVSFGRYVNSAGTADFVAMAQRTFGVDNPTDVGNFRTGSGSANTYPLIGPVVFTEIMYNPPLIGTNDNTRDEFLEIRNTSTAGVSLFDPLYPTNRWRLRGGVDFDFPATSIPAGGTLLIVGFDPTTNAAEATAFKAAYGLSNNASLLGPWSGKLDNGGERIELQRPDAPQLPPSPDAGLVPYIVVERILYSDNAPWTTNADGTSRSLQRVSNTGYGNDPTNWVAAIPTPQPGSAGGSDSDGDGMADDWETVHGLIVGVNDAGADPDRDGMNNLQEYLAGTDPQSAASKLSVAISLASPSAVRVQFDASANVSYTFQHRASLSTGSWLNLQSVPSAPNGRTVIITNTPGAMRFYRVTAP